MNSTCESKTKSCAPRIIKAFAACVIILTGGMASAQDLSLKAVQSCVTIRGLASSGSGFFFKAKNGKTYIATNKHVVEDAISIEIRDIDDDVFKPVKIWVDPNRDVALIEFDGGKKNPHHVLLADMNVSEMSFGREIVAYGDSDGADTIVALEGKLLGIGPSTIEIDAQLIKGNSGGPVVDQRTGAVLGISTFLKSLGQAPENAKGTRFEGKIRRFGTRIDNLKFENLRVADYIKYAFDDYEGLAEYATKLLKTAKNGKKVMDHVSSILYHVSQNNEIAAMGKVASKLLEAQPGEGDDVIGLAVEAILSASENDSITALTWKGVFTWIGVGTIAKDSKKAFECFLKAAENGDAVAQYFLSSCYRDGLGVPKNEDKAREWLKKSADNGLEDAVGEYGYLLLQEGNPEARKYIDAAVALDSEMAFVAQGLLSMKEEKKEEATYWFRRGAEANNSEAMCYLANSLRDGYGVNRNIHEAIHWYTNSVALGNIAAIQNLGYLYLDANSEHGTRNYEESLKWFMRGAEMYDGESLCRIGLAYLEGLGVETNASKALFYMEKSAACGYPTAMSNVAYFYADGIGTETNIYKALHWHERGYNQTKDGGFAWNYCEALWRMLSPSHAAENGEDRSPYMGDWLTWFVRGRNSDGARAWLNSVAQDDKRFQ